MFVKTFSTSLPMRKKIFCAISLIAYLATVLGAGNNLVYLTLAAVALITASKALWNCKILRFSLAILFLAMLIGSATNGSVAAFRSATPYMALLVALSLMAPQRKNESLSIDVPDQRIFILYAAGLLQLATYLIQATLSNSYTLFYSHDEFHRFSIGWISIICFFYTSLPASKKTNLTGQTRLMGAIFWLVPILAALNSSRSELLMVVLLFGISMYFRRPLILATTLAALFAIVFLLPNLTDEISVVARASRSFEEIFQGDLNTVSDVHTNYRAFENLMMVDRIMANNPMNMVYGCGLGCAVPFPFTMTLEDIDYDEISVFHNGYLTVFLHFGLLGVALLAALARLLFAELVNFSQQYRSGRAEVSNLQYTALRLAVFFILLGTAATTGGFMSSQDMLIMLLPLSCTSPRAWRTKQSPVPRPRMNANVNTQC